MNECSTNNKHSRAHNQLLINAAHPSQIFPMETVQDVATPLDSKYEVDASGGNSSSLLPEFEAATQEQTKKQGELMKGGYPETERLLDEKKKLDAMLEETMLLLEKAPDSLRTFYEQAVVKCKADLEEIVDKLDQTRGGRRLTITNSPQFTLAKLRFEAEGKT